MSERFTIVIETGNAAFEDSPTEELAQVLERMAARVREAGELPVPRDSNGNKVGSVTVEKGITPC